MQVRDMQDVKASSERLLSIIVLPTNAVGLGNLVFRKVLSSGVLIRGLISRWSASSGLCGEEVAGDCISVLYGQ